MVKRTQSRITQKPQKRRKPGQRWPGFLKGS